MGGGSSKPKKAPTPAISSTDRAVLDLKNARDRLQRYRKKLEQDDARLVAQAKKARDAGKTKQAIGILRLRKYKEAQATNCENQLLNVLQMVETIDSKKNESQVLSALAAGKDTLKKMHEETTVEDVLDLMDAVREEIEVEQEINTILEGVPTLSPEDEEAVEAELEAMAAEMNGVATDTKVEQLPVAPSTTLPELKVPETKEPAKETRVAVPG
uniref:Charged multivesicular body protein 6 n=1 Tax=Amphora coffeiformis TaxID=265554 RepID=A0A7S3P9H7_9STRA|mmetsp:Transcript_4088/g.8241  ORF Transcript_4088/g.8241 Transcript_4088/m.8241 type:complete len:214 (-) Transcript_4088:60-701(-)|eukprot:scaffold132_cov170-Amphora_coffeaeformis.AAC.51